MKQYTVRHRATYRYQSDVAYSRLLAHLVPRATARQQPAAHVLTVSPRPAEHAERSDFFGNTTNSFVIDEPHAKLDILAESELSVEAIPAYVAHESFGWEAARASFEAPLDADTLEAVQYAFDTPLTALNETVLAYAQTSFVPGRPLFASALELNSRIHADFRYEKDATDTRTTVERVFELRAGVCQDLAHVGIAAVRSMGLAARYVSGYLLTHPPADASVSSAPMRAMPGSASDSPFGWVVSTRQRCYRAANVTAAWGRDYGDVAPSTASSPAERHEVKVAVVLPRNATDLGARFVPCAATALMDDRERATVAKIRGDRILLFQLGDAREDPARR